MRFALPYRLIAGLSLGCVLVLPVHAIDWDGDAANDGDASGDYGNPLNWDGDVLPSAFAFLRFDTPGAYTVTIDTQDVNSGNVSIFESSPTFLSDFANNTRWDTGDWEFVEPTTTATLRGFDLSLNQLRANFESRVELDQMTTEMNALIAGISFATGFVTVRGGTTDIVAGGGAFGQLQIRGNDALNPSTVLLTDSADVSTVSVDIGGQFGETGVLRIDQNADLEVGPVGSFGELRVGAEGDGTVIVANGGRLTTGAQTAVRLGDTLVGGGTSTVRVESGGRIDFSGTSGVEANPTGTIVNAGGTITIGGDYDNAGLFEQAGSADAVTVIDGFYLPLPGSSSSFRLADGRVTLGGGGGFDPGTFEQTGGTLRFEAVSDVSALEIALDDADAGETARWEVAGLTTWGRRLRVGSAANTRGAIDVESGGVLQNFANGSATAADLAVGFNGNGTLNATGTGRVDVFDDLILGQNNGGFGTMTLADDAEVVVDRNGSGSNVFVGFNGIGVVAMSDRALLTVGNDLVIQVGSAQPATAESALTFVAGQSTADTTVTVGNNLLIGPVAQNLKPGALRMNGLGTVEVGNTTRVRGSGVLDIDGGGTLKTNILEVSAGGSLTLDDGTLTAFTVAFDPAAIVMLTGGTFETPKINGDVLNTGATLSPDSGLASGARTDITGITGDLTQGAAATLLMQIEGSQRGDDYDSLDLSGTLTLDAGTTLNVELGDRVSPTLGEQFVVANAGSVTGTFGSLVGDLPGGGLLWDLVYQSNQVLLQVIEAGLVGDYDDSGTVEQSDLNLVLSNWGQVAPFAPNGDPFVTATVDQEELNRVLTNWGSSTAPSFASFAGFAVPEPGVMLVVGLAGLGLRRRR